MKNLKSIKPVLLVFSFLLITLLFLKTIPFISAPADRASVLPLTIFDNKLSNTESPPDDAPEIKNKTGKWINTVKDLQPEDFKGKVLLIEFWTFGCYNCTNTLPFINKWYEKYKSDKFEIIGIHSPEFDNERNFDNVKRNVDELGIKYPVLTDNEFSIWQKYDVHAWPTIFLIDKKGEIRYKKVGEGKYDITEEKIVELINE